MRVGPRLVLPEHFELTGAYVAPHGSKLESMLMVRENSDVNRTLNIDHETAQVALDILATGLPGFGDDPES